MASRKILALDYGKKRIGVASGDFEFKIAFPRGIIFNKGINFVFDEIFKIIDELDISEIVVGMPFDNAISKEVENFIEKLSNKFKNIKVSIFDERLSSFEADKLMNDAAKKYGDKRLNNDSYAALVILQRFFNSIK